MGVRPARRPRLRPSPSFDVRVARVLFTPRATTPCSGRTPSSPRTRDTVRSARTTRICTRGESGGRTRVASSDSPRCTPRNTSGSSCRPRETSRSWTSPSRAAISRRRPRPVPAPDPARSSSRRAAALESPPPSRPRPPARKLETIPTRAHPRPNRTWFLARRDASTNRQGDDDEIDPRPRPSCTSPVRTRPGGVSGWTPGGSRA